MENVYYRYLINLALLIQLLHLRVNKRVSKLAFFLISVSTWGIAWEYYQSFQMINSKVLNKIICATLFLLIAILA